MSEMINVTINGMGVCVPAGSTIMEAARYAGIYIPSLCFLKDINENANCRICVVEVKGAKTLVAACSYPCNPGMEIQTNSEKVLKSRRLTLELILSNHEKKCLSCIRSDNCELQKLCRELGVQDENYYKGVRNNYPVDDSALHLVRDPSKCVLCRRCTSMCSNIQKIGVIGPNERGFKTIIGSAFEMGLGDTSCIGCGQCITVCPVGALYEHDNTEEVWAALRDPSKYVVVQTAPAVRAALGEEFGFPMGTPVEGKMAAALRRLGFDKVFDTNFGADLTIMEEANEFVERYTTGGKLPLITSCSPGWIKFCEHYYPEFVDNLSSCKSPQQMFGATLKTYWAQKHGIDPKDIVSVSVMPCTAKKYEIKRKDEDAAGVPDVDISITTRELARMIKRVGIAFKKLPDEKFDEFMGDGTGAAVIFGATGGVMEAALRTAYETITGKTLENVNFDDVRGVQGIKEATYILAGNKVKVAVASGTGNAATLLNMVKNGEAYYDFIEIMGCPGGCVNGGGQPIVPSYTRNVTDIRAERAKALYSLDEANLIRKSHENPSIKQLYAEFFEKPGSHKAHEILHTTYEKRPLNPHEE